MSLILKQGCFSCTEPVARRADQPKYGVKLGRLESLDQQVPERDQRLHPADTNDDWRMEIGEVTAYGAAWKTGATWPVPPNPIPIDYVTNAGFLWINGEIYHFDATQNPPGSWLGRCSQHRCTFTRHGKRHGHLQP